MDNSFFSYKIIKSESSYIEKNEFKIDDLFINAKEEDCILITGQVQSGKTGKIIEIIKTAVTKYKYNLVILLGGFTNNLLEQTQVRLQNGLKNLNPENDPYFLFEIIKWNNKKNTISPNSVINILKNKDNLKMLRDKLRLHKNENHSILIIDDESDFYSPKTSKKNYQENDNVEDREIYELLKSIYNEIKQHYNYLYINVTATPFANIINNYQSDFNIKAVYSLPMNEKYSGLKYFNDNSSKHYLSDSLFLAYDNKNEKYINLITFWLMQTILYFKDDLHENKSELIIFDSIKKNKHQEIKDILFDSIINNEELFIQSFYILKEKYENFFEITLDEFKKIFNILKNNLDDSLIVLNSDNNNVTNNFYNSEIELKIYIGGFMLSRGITFNNLLIEYFGTLNENIDYDTLLQRCRWFGYRKTETKNLLDYMKVICSEKTQNELKLCEKYVDYFFNNQTWNGAKFDLTRVRNKIIPDKKITSSSKRKG